MRCGFLGRDWVPGLRLRWQLLQGPVVRSAPAPCPRWNCAWKPAAATRGRRRSARGGDADLPPVARHWYRRRATWHRPAAAPRRSASSFTIARLRLRPARRRGASTGSLTRPCRAAGAAPRPHAGLRRSRSVRYDHATAPASGCSGCHEAGSDLAAHRWTLTRRGRAGDRDVHMGSGTVADRGGDTRPPGISSLACRPARRRSCAARRAARSTTSIRRTAASVTKSRRRCRDRARPARLRVEVELPALLRKPRDTVDVLPLPRFAELPSREAVAVDPRVSTVGTR